MGDSPFERPEGTILISDSYSLGLWDNRFLLFSATSL